MAKIYHLFAASLLLFAGSCQGDPDGTRLFDVIYPITEFDIPAGQARFRSFVVAQPVVDTRFVEAMRDANVTADDVDLVGGFRARVVSLTGDDFGEFERMELRACPVGQENGCDQFDLLFSVDDLFRRRQTTVDLNPGLRNFRELFLGDEMRIELVLVAGDITSTSLRARLEWSAIAFGDLE